MHVAYIRTATDALEPRGGLIEAFNALRTYGGLGWAALIIPQTVEERIAWERRIRDWQEEWVKEPGEVTGPPSVVPSASLRSVEEVVAEHVAKVMEAVGGNMSEAARILGVDRRTLYRWSSAGKARHPNYLTGGRRKKAATSPGEPPKGAPDA